MAEEKELSEDPKPEVANEKVGDLLRKERITKRIALETIAKDLKLNVKYIRALESNEYHDLPADPYIRVYLRSLAKYLLLDPEDILKKFYEERGIHEEKYRKGSESKITITMSDQEKKKETKPWIIILIVIVILAGISLIAKKIGNGPASPSAGNHKVMTKADSLAGKSNGSGAESSDDSILGSFIPHEQATANDSATSVVKDTSTMTLELHVKSTKDSVWIQAFSDGISWKNWLKPNGIKRLAAKDSFNLHIGNSKLIEYTFNGKPLKIETLEVAIFKLGKPSKQPEIWSLSKWNTVFKGKI